MGNIKIRQGVFDTKLELEHAGVAAGFPSPADDYRHETLDFNRDYIRHPEASFYGDVEGDSMKDAGLFDGDRVKLTFNNIVIQRTWRELNGEDCVPNEEMAKKKSICTSRSFNGMISDYDTLRTHVSNYAARCAEKLRQQKTVASIVGVFVNTNASERILHNIGTSRSNA